MEKRLYRDELNKKIAGVCAGLADYLSVDVTVIRAIFAIGIFLNGATLVPYIVLWIVLPKKPYFLNDPHVDYTVPPQNAPFNPFTAGGVPPRPPFVIEPAKRTSSAGLIAGIALVLFGSFFLLEQFDLIPFLSFRQVWPVILIIVGVAIIFSGQEKKPGPAKEKWDAAEKTDEDLPADDNTTDNSTSQQ